MSNIRLLTRFRQTLRNLNLNPEWFDDNNLKIALKFLEKYGRR